jgi:hypothetical protein
MLERVRPATPLAAGGDRVAIDVAADLLTRPHRAQAATFPFPALDETYGQVGDQARDNAACEGHRSWRRPPARPSCADALLAVSPVGGDDPD